MLWSAEGLRGYSIRATDDTLGRVKDIYFDDASWRVRYLVADTARWLFGRTVLIATSALGQPDPAAREFPVALTREQVKNSPGIDADKPVSRQYETELHAYYGWAPYWAAGGAALGPGLVAAPGLAAAPLIADPPAGRRPDEDRPRGDPHLRSEHEVRGYAIGASDGDIGHVADMLIEDASWTVRYLVVDTSNWLPRKHVLIAPHWVQDIVWTDRRVFVDLTRRQVEDSPEYDPSMTVDRAYEERLYSHYTRPPYWI